MGITGIIGNLLQQYAGGAPPAPAAAEQHFDQVAQGVDHATLSSGIGSMMRSPETPDFGNIFGQLFRNATDDQKASMLNALKTGASPAVLSQLSDLLPGLGAAGTISAAQAQTIPPASVTRIAAHAEQQNPSVVDTISSVCAAHPGLVKTLGAGAMIIALRELAKKIAP